MEWYWTHIVSILQNFKFQNSQRQGYDTYILLYFNQTVQQEYSTNRTWITLKARFAVVLEKSKNLGKRINKRM